jgi:hypothetical protein
MAIARLSNIGTVGTSASNVSVSGVEHITEVTVEESVGTIVKAKNALGDVNAVLVAKTRKTLTASGYGSAVDAPALGLKISGPANFNGITTETSMEASAEDFTKFSITAVGL